MKRQLCQRALLAALALLACLNTQLATAAYPDRPVKVIVSLPPGSGADTTARFLAKHLTQEFGEPFVVENRPGANSFIAAKFVAESPPDGYTMFVASNSPMVTNAAVFSPLPYDPLRDFAPVTSIVRLPMVIVVASTSPHRSLQHLVTAAKAAPGRLNYAAGTPTYHVAMELFHERNGMKANAVTYKGTGPAVTDVAAGTVDYTIAEISSVLPLIRAGRLRALGVASAERLKDLPDVPTVSESGTPGFEASAWTGVFFPAKVPAAIVQRVGDAIRTVLRAPEGVSFINALGGILFVGSPEQLRDFQAAEIDMTRRIVKAANVPVE